MKLYMKKALKKGLPLAVATTLVFSYGVDASLVKGKSKHTGGAKVKVEQKGYSDTKGYWGEDSIDKMSALGVIQGYADGTFKPNKPVTHQEAIVLIVRLLGLEEEAKKRAEQGVLLPFKNSASIANWAHGHVDVALELGLIEGSHVFRANKAASRMYVTALMVEGLGMDVSAYENVEVGFSDISDLTAEERLQLAVAVTEGLANGYGDKKFQPNKPVTRGEMVAFLERTMNHLEDDRESTNDEKVIWGNLEGISSFNLKLSSGQNKIDYVYDAEEAEEIYVLSQIDGKSALLTGQDAAVEIKEIVETYLEEDAQFDVNKVSAELAGTVKATRSATWAAKLDYATDEKTLTFDVQKNSNSEASNLTWAKDEAALSYSQTTDGNDKVVSDLEYKDPETNNEVNYRKEVNGGTVTATGTLKINGVTISIRDTSLEPTIKSIIAEQDLRISF